MAINERDRVSYYDKGPAADREHLEKIRTIAKNPTMTIAYRAKTGLAWIEALIREGRAGDAGDVASGMSVDLAFDGPGKVPITIAGVEDQARKALRARTLTMLNRLVALDERAIRQLLEARAVVNKALEKDVSPDAEDVVISAYPGQAPKLGVLGLINGILGTDYRIDALIEDDGHVTSFRPYTPPARPVTMRVGPAGPRSSWPLDAWRIHIESYKASLDPVGGREKVEYTVLLGGPVKPDDVALTTAFGANWSLVYRPRGCAEDVRVDLGSNFPIGAYVPTLTVFSQVTIGAPHAAAGAAKSTDWSPDGPLFTTRCSYCGVRYEKTHTCFKARLGSAALTKFDRNNGEWKSTVVCTCGASLTWESVDERLYAFEIEHAPHVLTPAEIDALRAEPPDGVEKEKP